jgi:hypothetical protein
MGTGEEVFCIGDKSGSGLSVGLAGDGDSVRRAREVHELVEGWVWELGELGSGGQGSRGGGSKCMSKGKDGVGVGVRGENDGGLVCDADVRKGNMDSKKTTSLETIIRCVVRSKNLYPFFP